MNAPTITREGEGRYRIAGDLVFATAKAALKDSSPKFAAERELAIDLSAVKSADSAGLALLIEWYAQAARANKSIRFSAAPAQLVALAKISDIDTLLPFC